jgi:hypothetical protein
MPRRSTLAHACVRRKLLAPFRLWAPTLHGAALRRPPRCIASCLLAPAGHRRRSAERILLAHHVRMPVEAQTNGLIEPRIVVCRCQRSLPMSTTLNAAPAATNVEAGAPEAPATPAPAAAPAPTWSGANRRTSGHLINLRRQLPGSLAATLATLLLVLLLNLVLHHLTAWNTRVVLASFPEMEAHVTRSNLIRSGMMYAFSAMLTAGVFVVSLKRQHRTLGPIVNFRNCMKRVGEGDLSVRVKLRKHDNLMEIQESFNTMMDAIDLRTRREMAALEGAVSAARGLAPQAAARDLAQVLESLRSEKERALSRNPAR